MSILLPEDGFESCLEFLHQSAYSLDEVDGFVCSFFDAGEHEEHPCLPFAVVVGGVVPDGLDESVVVGFVARDEAAQVEDGEVEQLIDDEIEYVDYTTCAPIAVKKRVYAFELMVDDGHFDQRIAVRKAFVVDEGLEVGHEAFDVGGILRGSIDHGAALVFELSPRH